MMIEYTLLTTLAFHHLVIGTILFLILLLVQKFVASSAELRSWLWMTAFVISTAIPFSLISLDTSPNSQSVNTVTDPDANTAVHTETNIVNTQQAIAEPVANWHFPSEIVFNFSVVLTAAVFIWLFGSIWRSVTLLSSYVKTQHLLHSTITTAPQLSTGINAQVYTSNRVASPMVVGLIKPKIIIPSSITEQLQQEQLLAIVLHENAHIKRKDNWFGLLQEIVAILFWWSPIIRIFNHKIHVEREIACDLRAVNTMKNTKQYAQSLIDCAKLMITEQRSILAMGLFSKKKELNYRVGAVLKNSQLKKPSVTIVTVLCGLLTITTIQATQLLSPKISIKHTQTDARQYSLLPQYESQILLAAVTNNDINTIKSLQNNGVDINVPIIGDGTILMIAVKQNDPELVQTLISMGADVDQPSSGDGNPLIVAAMNNHIEIAKLLLDNGADVNQVVARDETALINAAFYGFYEMSDLLIARGADVNLAVRTGASDGFELRTPLNRARNNRIKDLLIANGARQGDS